MRLLLKSRHGATAVEFALIAPYFFAMAFGSIAIGIAIWNTSVGCPDCTVLPAGCDFAASICSIMTLADKPVLPGLRSSNIAIDPAALAGTAISTHVTLTRSFEMTGYSITLSGSASYPNS